MISQRIKAIYEKSIIPPQTSFWLNVKRFFVEDFKYETLLENYRTTNANSSAILRLQKYFEEKEKDLSFSPKGVEFELKDFYEISQAGSIAIMAMINAQLIKEGLITREIRVTDSKGKIFAYQNAFEVPPNIRRENIKSYIKFVD